MIFSGNFPTINGFVRFAKNNNLTHDQFIDLYYEVVTKKEDWSFPIPNFNNVAQEHLINETQLAGRMILKSLKPSISNYLEKKLSINFNQLIKFIKGDDNDLNVDKLSMDLVKLIDLVYNLEANPDKKELRESMLLQNIRFDIILTSRERQVFSLLTAGMTRDQVKKQCSISEEDLNKMISHSLIKNNWITTLMVPITRKYFFSDEEFLIMNNYYTHVVDNIYVLNKFRHHAESMLEQLRNNLINNQPVINDFFKVDNVKNYFKLANYHGHWISIESGEAAMRDIMKFKGLPFNINDEFINELFIFFNNNGLNLTLDYIKNLAYEHSNSHKGMRVTEEVEIINEDEYDLCKNDFIRRGFVFVKKHASDSILQNIWDRLCDELNVHTKARYQAFLSNDEKLTIHQAIYELFKDSQFTKEELEKETGLSESTVSNLVGETIVKVTKAHYMHVYALNVIDEDELPGVMVLIDEAIAKNGQAQLNRIVTGRDAIEELKYKLKKKYIFKENIAYPLSDFVPEAPKTVDNDNSKQMIIEELKSKNNIEEDQKTKIYREKEVKEKAKIAKAKKEKEDKAKAKAEAEMTAKQKEEAEAKAKAEAEQKEKEARAKAEAEVKANEEAKARAKEKAEKEAKEKAEKEAKEKAEKEAKEKAEKEKAIAAAKAQAKVDSEKAAAEAKQLVEAQKAKDAIAAEKKFKLEDLDFGKGEQPKVEKQLKEKSISFDDLPDIEEAESIHEKLNKLNADGSRHLIMEDSPEIEKTISIKDLPKNLQSQAKEMSDAEIMDLIQQEALMAEIAIMAGEANKANEGTKMSDELASKQKETRQKTQVFFTKAPKTRLVYEDNSSVIHEDEEYEDDFDNNEFDDNDGDFSLEDGIDDDFDLAVEEEKEKKKIIEEIQEKMKEVKPVEVKKEKSTEDNVGRIIDVANDKFSSPFTRRELIAALDFEPTEEEFRIFIDKKCINILGSSNGSVFELKPEYKK